jgi:branched-chain amino acid transport system permease protein
MPKRAEAAIAMVALCALALVAVAPAFAGAYWMRILSTVFMYAVIAQGINIMAGYTGYPAFGNVVFFGLGAYATAVLMVKLKLSFAASALAATALCPLVVLLVGPPLLRLKGHYFAIATLGLNEAVRELVLNVDLTGGGMGLTLPLPPGTATESAVSFYYLFLGVLLASTWITWEFSRRRLGLACRAIRDNEAKAEASGLHTTRYKTIAWMLSAAMTGAVGGINAYWLTYINAPSVFDMGIAVKAFVIFLLGGAATVLGPIAGAVIVETLGTLTWSHFLNWHLGAMGLVIMIVIALFPEGVRGALRGR